MSAYAATAVAHPNIAFIKYWGNRDADLRLPVNGSLSMNLQGLETRTAVSVEPELAADRITINGKNAEGDVEIRASRFLDIVRKMAGSKYFARVDTANNFPMGAGIASSASGFAALAAAASQAYNLLLSERDLSRLARRGSGSACRSIPGGFVEWLAGADDYDSYAVSIACPDYWNLVDCVTVVEKGHKIIGSFNAQVYAPTSPIQNARVEDTPRRLALCREAILRKDFEGLAAVAETDSNLLHAVIMTSTPNIIYWNSHTLEIMLEVIRLREQGWPVFYTVDAGPNIHVLTLSDWQLRVQETLRYLPGVLDVLCASPGGHVQMIK